MNVYGVLFNVILANSSSLPGNIVAVTAMAAPVPLFC